jgi:hypothetical protein
MIVLRFVCHDDGISRAIIAVTGGQVAHAEAIMRGGTIIGAFAEGGVQERRLDYDGGEFKFEQLIALPADDDMTARFEHYLRSPNVLGEKYDYFGLLDFVEHFDLHTQHKVFCSATMQDDLRWVGYFPNPLPIPAHKVSPLMLQQMVLSRPDVRVITRDDPIFLAHIASEKRPGG